MRKISLSPFSVLVFLFISTYSAELIAQERGHHHNVTSHPVFLEIEQAVQLGEINRDEAIIQKFYAGFEPERLHARFQTDDKMFIKCMVPVQIEFEQYRHELSAAVISEVETILAENLVQSTTTHQYSFGNFLFFYDIEGDHAVPAEDSNQSGIPDYVEHAAFAADSSYRYQVEQLGFRDFLRNDPYEITFRSIGPYGTTTETGSTTRITIHNDFDGFPPNTHPEGDQIGALYATIAHEIKHAIQFATNRWKGEPGEFNWIEMDATLMEEIVFPDVNDYYNYIMSYNQGSENWNQNNPNNNSIFGRPQNSTPGAYWHVTWMLYFAENYGINFWVDVWNQIRADYLDGDESSSFLDSMNAVLQPNGLSVDQEHMLNHIWHMSAGPVYSPAEFGFEDRQNYPTAFFRHQFQLMPDAPAELNEQSLNSYAANYISLTPSNVTLGQPSFYLESFDGTPEESPVNGVGIAITGYFQDGSTEKLLALNPNSNQQALQTTWSWGELTRINVAVINTNREENAVYNFRATSTIPDNDAISQNYPNPFGNTTQIEFSLNSTKDVKIEVYDSIGRKVSTLVDERLDQGFHSVTFNGSGLASGVYLYRIITDESAITKKMVLIH